MCQLGALSWEIMKNNVQLMSQTIHHSDGDSFQDGLKRAFFLHQNNLEIGCILRSGSGFGGGGGS